MNTILSQLMKPADEKLCTSCNRTLPISHFGKRSSSYDGYQYACKECLKERRKQKNADRHPAENKYLSICKNAEPHFTIEQLVDWYDNTPMVCYVSGMTLDESQKLLFAIDTYDGDSELVKRIKRRLSSRAYGSDQLVLSRKNQLGEYTIDNIVFIDPVCNSLRLAEHDIDLISGSIRHVIDEVKLALGF